MKIGILTLPLHTNYGGNLQAYALMTVLKKMGHEAWMIDRAKNKVPFKKWFTPLLKQLIKKHVLRRAIYIDGTKQKELLAQNITPFLSKYIQPSTKTFHSSSELENIAEYNFDACIVGSDQVWRPQYTPNIEDYFFQFINSDKIKKISYAASFGVDAWEFSDEETTTCSSLLKKFSAVAVREDSAVKMCKEKFDVDATHVLDPTMLLEVSDYVKLISGAGKSDGDLLVYVLDESREKELVMNAIISKFGYKAFKTNTPIDDTTIPHSLRIAPSIEGWVRGFYDAKFVLTDSFHACVFSILFNKPFIVYGNKSRGMVRFKSLLSMFSLEDRLITSLEEFNDQKLNATIDWPKVNLTLQKHKKFSNDFLASALNHD